MKKRIFMICLMAGFFLFSGCPYESYVPIDVPNQNIDTLLLGKWEDRGDYTKPYTISKQDEYTYRIVCDNLKDKKSETYFAYTTQVDAFVFLNLWQEDTAKKRKYLLYKIENNYEGIIILKEVSEKISAKFTSGPALKKYISAHMHDSDFFNDHENLFINRNQIFDLNEKKKTTNIKLNETRKANGVMAMLILETLKLLQTATIIFVIVVIFMILVVYYYFKKRKSERLLANEKINSLMKDQKLKSMGAMMEGEENERKRIAVDLHDRLGSMLSTVKLYFSTLEEQIDRMKINNLEQYAMATTLLDEACDEVRRISNNLVSGELVKFGLVTALGQLKKTIEETGKLKINIVTFGMENRLESATEINIYRILQEIMNNILKHAKADTVTIQLNQHGNNLNIVVEDDGTGFDVEAAKLKGGMGLDNIGIRVNSLNGKLDIDSGKGKGTTMVIDIPV